MLPTKPIASRVINGKTVLASLVTDAFERNSRKATAASTSLIALALGACGSGSSTTSSTKLTLTKSGDTYSSTSVAGFSLADSSVAKYDIANASSNSYTIDLAADGAGVLEFDFADAGDAVVLNAGSKVTGFTTLKVTDGTLDATNADLSSITRVEVASGIKISLAQVKSIPTIVANSATSEITIEVASEAEATELVTLLTAGTVKVFGDTNPIKMVASETATVTAETLTTKVAETATSVKTVAEAPADTSTATTDTTTTTTDTTTTTTTTTSSGEAAPTIFAVSDEGSGAYTVDSGYGLVTVTSANSRYVFDPVDGASVSRVIADVNSLSVGGSLSGAAAVLDGETITGAGSVAITELEGDAAADLSNITVSGTKTIAVTDDVTFTGDLGSSFATTVSSGKTMTASAVIVAGQDIDGAGSLTITGGATVDTNLTNIDVTGTLSFDSNTIAITAAKTLTLDAVQAALATSGISGSGNLTVTDDGGSVAQTVKSTVDATGVKTIDVGSGDDIIDVGVAANVDTNDTFDGGAGSDTIKITADSNSTGAVLDDLVDINIITMVADSAKTAKVTITYTSANTDALVINASALTGGTANFSLVATDAEAAGAYTVTGTAGADTIKVGAGADIIEAGAGVDNIHVDDSSTTDTIIFNSVKGTSSDSIRVDGDNNEDIGQDTLHDLQNDDVILVKITNVDDFEHLDDVAIGTSTGTTYDGTAAGSFLATSVLIDVDGGTGWDDADDIVFNLTSADSTFNNDTTVEAIMKYELTADATGSTMTGGAKADTITGGAGVDNITGAAGGDTIVLGGASSGADVVKYTATAQTFTGLITSGSTALTGIDVITGAMAGDKLDLSSTSLGSSATYVAAGSVGTAVLGGSASKGDVALVRGTYDSSTTKFTAGTASGDDDYLVNWAVAATSSASASEAIVFMDIAGTVSLTESSEVYTIAVA